MIRLQLVSEVDAEDLFPLVYHTGVTDTLLWDGPETFETYRNGLKERKNRARQGLIHLFTIIEQESGRKIGTADIRPNPSHPRAEIGLWIGKPYHGKGYGTETIGWLVDYGFEKLGLMKIEANVFTGNWASRRIFEKNGFLLEGTSRLNVQKLGQLRDEWLFGLTRDDYDRMKSISGQGQTTIYHICPEPDWQQALRQGAYRAASLAEEGFIHCSTGEQVVGTANRFFSGIDNLLLLSIHVEKLESELRWEESDGKLFPHIYGPLNLEAIQSVQYFAPDSDGVFRTRP